MPKMHARLSASFCVLFPKLCQPSVFGTSHARKMQHILRMTGRPPSLFLLSPLNPWPHKHIHTLAGNRVDNGRGLNAPAHQGSSFHVIKFQTHDFGSMECQFVLYCISLPSIMIHDRAEWHPNMRGRIPSLKRQRRCQVSKSQVAQIMFSFFFTLVVSPLSTLWSFGVNGNRYIML